MGHPAMARCVLICGGLVRVHALSQMDGVSCGFHGGSFSPELIVGIVCTRWEGGTLEIHTYPRESEGDIAGQSRVQVLTENDLKRQAMATTASFWHTSEMARCSGHGLRFRCRWITRAAGLCGCVAGLGVGLCGSVAGGQEEATTTLHVYANTIQIPVLVLGADRQPTAPVAPGRFKVSLDEGPKFRATHVRLEGDDPISLAILLDVSGKETDLIPKIDEAIASLAPLSLTSRDHVSIYALECKLIRSLDDLPAEQGRLKSGVDAALQSWTNRGSVKRGSGCQNPVRLWDALTYLTYALSSRPGRRVVLAVTRGNDKGSKRSWKEVRTYAQAMGVAVFGLSYVPEETGHLHFLNLGGEDAFNSLCELSGGMVLTASRRTEAAELKRFVTMLRGRYIVEFPRPFHSKGGEHSLTVSIDKSDAFIRSSGVTVPIADPALLADPTTVPSDPSHTPEYGNRRILTSPQ